MKTVYFFSLILFFSSFYPVTVYIQPLGHVNQQYIKTVEEAIGSVYGFKCKLLPASPHDKSLYAVSQTRYEANLILKRFMSYTYTLVITEKDIAHHKNDRLPEYGILGLGSLTSKICVVSTHRLGSGKLLNERLSKVAVHEIGHTLGLDHCDQQCIMQDARGKLSVIDKANIQPCYKCKPLVFKPQIFK